MASGCRSPERDLLATAPIDEPEKPALGAPSEADDILADYHTTGLTLNRHPVALLRPSCACGGCRPRPNCTTAPTAGSRVRAGS